MKTKICIVLASVSLLSVCAAFGGDIKKPMRANTITTIDDIGEVGYHSSVAIGRDGYPVIAYHDMTNGTLKVAKCKSDSCRSAVITTVDNSVDVGQYTHIVIGADGLPVVSYYDSANQNLKLAKCGDASCTSGNTIATVDNTGEDWLGMYSSVSIGMDGHPVISYLDNTNQDLKVAKCGDESCSFGNTLTTVDSTGEAGYNSSLTIGTDGLPIVSYLDLTDGYGCLKVAKCENEACSVATISTVGDTINAGRYTSIAIGNDGMPVISHKDATYGTLKVVKCGNTSCSEGNVNTTVDDTELEIEFTSLAIGTDGMPIIAYYSRYNGYLKVAKCGNAACTTNNTITVVDTDGNVGVSPHITIGHDGLPVISYADETNRDLKFIRCANNFCISNWSSR